MHSEIAKQIWILEKFWTLKKIIKIWFRMKLFWKISGYYAFSNFRKIRYSVNAINWRKAEHFLPSPECFKKFSNWLFTQKNLNNSGHGHKKFFRMHLDLKNKCKFSKIPTIKYLNSLKKLRKFHFNSICYKNFGCLLKKNRPSPECWKNCPSLNAFWNRETNTNFRKI